MEKRVGKAAREALWLKEAMARQAPQSRKRKPLKDGQRGRWCVVRVYETEGRSVVVRSGLTATDAETLAGRMRDDSSDADVARGWNYLARFARTK